MKWLKLQVVVERRERERYVLEVARENPLKLTRNCFFPWRENILSSSLFSFFGRWALIVIYCNAFKRFIKVNEKLLRPSCDRRKEGRREFSNVFPRVLLATHHLWTCRGVGTFANGNTGTGFCLHGRPRSFCSADIGS